MENFNSSKPEVAKKKRRLCPDRKSVRPQVLFVAPQNQHPIPSPKHGSIYQPQEIAEYLSNENLSNKSRSENIEYIIKRKLIPIKRTALYDLLNRYRAGKSIRNTWNAPGRSRLLEDPDIQAITSELINTNGSSIGAQIVEEKIKEVQESNVRRDGLVPIMNSDKMKRTSVSNYMALIAHQPGISICRKVIDKTTSRYTAENSLISAMSLLCIIAATHFMVVPHMISDIYNEVKECAKGVRTLFDMVCKVHNNLPIFVAHPHLVMSSDDTVQYIFEGKGEKDEPYRLVSSQSQKEAGTRAKYKVNNSKHMHGMRVKLTYTFSAAGTNAPIFVTVTGLTEREMPKDDCIQVMIPGLSVGGGGVTLGNNVMGALLFMRGTEGMEAARYRIYRDTILLPFIQQTRNEFHGLKPGDFIPNELTAVCWCDGDLSQIQTIVQEQCLEIYRQHKIIANKQNPGRTGTEQPADLTKTFRLQKLLEHNFTLIDVPAERHPMKKSVSKALATLRSEGRLILKPNKSRAIIDFVSSLPEKTCKTTTRDNILEGFIQPGYIDSKKLRYPDLNKILSTCRRNPTAGEYALCIEKFPLLMQIVLEKGHIEDSVFEELGFPIDKDPEGNEVRRLAGIQQESRQRAKILTIKHQNDLRFAVITQVESERKRKAQDKIDILQNKIILNEACERKICGMLGKMDVQREYMAQATHEILFNLYVDELTAFILARKDDVSKSKLPKKRIIGDAILGEHNLIKIAFDIRSLPIILSLEPTATEICTHNEGGSTSSEINTHLLCVNSSGDADSNFNKASALLENNTWIEKVDLCFNPHKKMNVVNVSCELKLKADNIQRLLAAHLHRHLNFRVTNANKRKHWSFEWAAKNLHCIAAIMARYDLIKNDVLALDESATLLRSCTKFIKVGVDQANMHGAYLYFDTNDEKWIRSGKTTGNPFSKRNAAHARSAKQSILTSTFYRRYPSIERNVEQTCASSRKGYFENLEQYVALGFEIGNSRVEKILTNITQGESMFLFSKEEIQSITKMKKRGVNTWESKCVDVIAYLIELAFDIAISPLDNVSDNPGFESCHGMW